MEEGSLSPEVRFLLQGLVNLIFAPWRILGVIVIALAFIPESNENGLLMFFFAGVMLFMWKGPKTGRGYIWAVVLSVVGAGLGLWVLGAGF
jgi:hypothetical protein